jgi:hypothetical protein
MAPSCYCTCMTTSTLPLIPPCAKLTQQRRNTKTHNEPTAMSRQLWRHIPRCRRGPVSTVCDPIVAHSFSDTVTPQAHENGNFELMVHLFGTLPVMFRGATYNIPLSIWVPHAYPRQAPIAFVTPAKDMMIRPSNHVDLAGKCYHPYLANWAQHWEVELSTT